MLLGLIVTLVIIAVAFYILSLIPIDNVIKQIIKTIILLFAFLHIYQLLCPYYSHYIL